MQNIKVRYLSGLLILVVGCIVNHAIGRLELSSPRLLPIAVFPKQVGEWKMTIDRPEDHEVMQYLPTGRMVDRTYINTSGRIVNIALVTATNYNAFHDPKTCLPGHGWTLGEFGTARAGNQAINALTATQGQEKIRVFYWLAGSDGLYIPLGDYGEGEPLRKLFALKKLLTRTEEASLFVRLTTSGGEQNEGLLIDFAQAALPALKQLAATPVSRKPE